MKFSTVFLVFTASLVASQDLSGLPTCAVSCSINGLSSTGCAATDVACICKANSFITGISDCVKKACSAADIATTLQFAEKLCLSASVTLDAASLTASNTGAAPAATGSSAGGSSSGTKATTTAAGSKASTTATNGAAGAATTSAATASTSAPAANGAISQNPGSFGLVAFIAAGLAGLAL